MASFSNSVYHHCLARVSLTKTICMQKRFDICSIIVIIGGYFHIVTSNFKYFLTKKDANGHEYFMPSKKHEEQNHK